MKNTIITTHNQKNELLAPVAKVVELGKATALTLGHGNTSSESRQRPYGFIVRRSFE
jgi:hypothetical protein